MDNRLFTTPMTHNVPAQTNEEGKYFYLGYNHLSGVPLEPIVNNNGKFHFIKPQLKYDGVWEPKNHMNRYYEKTNWDLNNMPPNNFYGTHKFFHLPEKKCNGDVISPPDCGWNSPTSYCGSGMTYEELWEKNKPQFCRKPDFEDLWGYVPQDNRMTYMPMPEWSCGKYKVNL